MCVLRKIISKAKTNLIIMATLIVNKKYFNHVLQHEKLCLFVIYENVIKF